MKEEKDININQINKDSVTRNISMTFSTLFLVLTTKKSKYLPMNEMCLKFTPK